MKCREKKIKKKTTNTLSDCVLNIHWCMFFIWWFVKLIICVHDDGNGDGNVVAENAFVVLKNRKIKIKSIIIKYKMKNQLPNWWTHQTKMVFHADT